ncbi:hypothetical protein IC582_028814 [Cucumis melo]|uniref:Agamous-like MADS-box protein AGL62 n=2 Tax=Cucumis melo TaxID=3656 RepID=A0A5D3CLQ1_CUCMM|nr:agamous-like MADS-box protein AGL62 [Cucumis melo var. makuwa]TYK12360.1 agamous-like MADS-box protein AGL62 [Cucumis melo var. makuwa]
MKKSLGRRKIEIKKLDKKSTQQVTFSKRRAGLFNKAAELSILCGAEIAVLVFSSRGKIYTFGHPNVDALLDRFLTGNNTVPPKPAEAYLPIAELNRDLSKAEAEFEIEKRRAAERSRNSERFWWDEPLESMKIDELKRFRSSLVELRANVVERLEKIEDRHCVTPSIDIAESIQWPETSSIQLAAGNNHCLPSFHMAENRSVAMDWEAEIWG